MATGTYTPRNRALAEALLERCEDQTRFKCGHIADALGMPRDTVYKIKYEWDHGKPYRLPLPTLTEKDIEEALAKADQVKKEHREGQVERLLEKRQRNLNREKAFIEELKKKMENS